MIIVVVLVALSAAAFGPTLLTRALAARRRRVEARRRDVSVPLLHDPGRERRAERKALQLLRSVVDGADFELYERFGFLRVRAPGGGRSYLIYPHLPIVSYDPQTYRPISEFCVEFPDQAETAYGERLPDADDALAKWMSLRGDERGLLAGANMHAAGRQVELSRLRRDLQRLRDWERRELRAAGGVRPSATSRARGRGATA